MVATMSTLHMKAKESKFPHVPVFPVNNPHLRLWTHTSFLSKFTGRKFHIVMNFPLKLVNFNIKRT